MNEGIAADQRHRRGVRRGSDHHADHGTATQTRAAAGRRTPSVERLHKTDKDEPEIRIIPPTKPPPSEPVAAAHESSDPPQEPPRAVPKVEDVVPPVEPTPAAPPQSQAQSNNGVCARYGGYKVTTYRHGWQSWHCVYPHRR